MLFIPITWISTSNRPGEEVATGEKVQMMSPLLPVCRYRSEITTKEQDDSMVKTQPLESREKSQDGYTSRP